MKQSIVRNVQKLACRALKPVRRWQHKSTRAHQPKIKWRRRDAILSAALPRRAMCLAAGLLPEYVRLCSLVSFHGASQIL